jgi:hypothetical protein
MQISLKTANVRKAFPLNVSLYVIHMKHQQMPHALTYSILCKRPYFRHLAILGLNK